MKRYVKALVVEGWFATDPALKVPALKVGMIVTLDLGTIEPDISVNDCFVDTLEHGNGWYMRRFAIDPMLAVEVN